MGIKDEEDFWLLKMEIKTFLQLLMSDSMGKLYGKANKELFLTQKIVYYLSITELLRLSYTCKRIYILMGDVKVLHRF